MPEIFHNKMSNEVDDSVADTNNINQEEKREERRRYLMQAKVEKVMYLIQKNIDEFKLALTEGNVEKVKFIVNHLYWIASQVKEMAKEAKEMGIKIEEMEVDFTPLFQEAIEKYLKDGNIRCVRGLMKLYTDCKKIQKPKKEIILNLDVLRRLILINIQKGSMESRHTVEEILSFIKETGHSVDYKDDKEMLAAWQKGFLRSLDWPKDDIIYESPVSTVITKAEYFLKASEQVDISIFRTGGREFQDCLQIAIERLFDYLLDIKDTSFLQDELRRLLKFVNKNEIALEASSVKGVTEYLDKRREELNVLDSEVDSLLNRSKKTNTVQKYSYYKLNQ